MHDDRTVFIIFKKKDFTAFNQVKNNLEQVGALLSLATIERHSRESKYRGFQLYMLHVNNDPTAYGKSNPSTASGDVRGF